jgi:RimJ/RimL family protein N-acetyltransferase
VDFLEWELPLEPGDVYQFDSFTLPAFRGAGIAGARVAWMARFFRERGARRLLAVVWPGNPPAFRPLEKAGYRRAGSLRVFRLGAWRRVIHTRSRSRQ